MTFTQSPLTNDNKDFMLRGKLHTDDEGRYTLRTIKPLGYRPDSEQRPAHIHVKASFGKSPILTTQLYFKGDPWNRHDPAVRPSLIMSPRREAEALVANFDFVIRVGWNHEEPMIRPAPSQVDVKPALFAALLFFLTVPRFFAEVPVAELINAIQGNDQKKLGMLLKHGANANLMNRERRSALMLAESEGHREVVKLLKGAVK